MRMRMAALCAFVLAACGAAPGESSGVEGAAGGAEVSNAATQEPSPNLATLAEGAVLVTANVDAARALSLTDGAEGTNWSSGGPRYPGPYSFVIELRAPTRLTQIGVEGAGSRPGGAAGASARQVRIEASSESAEAGYAPLGAVEAAEDGETLLEIASEQAVRWLRFTIESNHGNADWTYLDGVSAYGAQTPPTEAGRFTGVFQVRPREFVELRQDGASISGCYVEAAGHAVGDIRGDVVEGVARLAWRRTDGGSDVSGVALLVIDSRGHLNGVRFRDRSRTVWAGGPAPEGTTTPCSAAPAPANPIAQALEEEGEVRIYGILFDFDQATLKASSEPALQQLLAALQGGSSLSVDIEGHTDSVGEDAYNLSLSEQRAQSVVAWLVDHGIAESRLHAVGKGETAPVASNDTADGRALNRRVEVRRR